MKYPPPPIGHWIPGWQLDELAGALQPHLMAMMLSPNGYPMFTAEDIQHVWEVQQR